MILAGKHYRAAVAHRAQQEAHTARRRAFEDLHRENVPIVHLPAVPEPREAAPGDCPRCGRHIGRGVGFHVKRCKGASDG